MSDFWFAVLWFVIGIAAARFHHWAITDDSENDDLLFSERNSAAREAVLDIAATTRRAEEQLKNMRDPSGVRPHP